MKIFKILPFLMIMSVFIAACSDETDFSSDPTHCLTFAAEEITFDTLFTTVPSSRSGMMVYNRNDKALRITSVELLSGGDSGFRVLVDGQYGTFIRDIEIWSNDSLYVFAELTPPKNGADKPLKVEDKLRFTLESGVQQEIALSAYGRDVSFMRAVKVKSDSLITAGHYVVYDSLVVAEGVTLTIAEGANLYFHDKVPMVVRGTLSAVGTKEKPVIFRGDRTDNMFSYLPYDRIPGQWDGIVLAPTSNGNVFEHCDIHSANYGIKVEPGDEAAQRIIMNASRLENFYGNALELVQAHADVTNTLLANAGGNCVKVVGGNVNFIHCTIANFFVYKVRDVALTLHNSYSTTLAPLHGANFINCLITGSKKDELMGYLTDLGEEMPPGKNYHFENSLINTVVGEDENFVNVTIDEKDVSPFAAEHFTTIDHDVFLYDFHLTDQSTARSMGSEAFLNDEKLRYDKDGVLREPGFVDVGCYQYVDVPDDGETEE